MAALLSQSSTAPDQNVDKPGKQTYVDVNYSFDN